ncbi:MAG: CPBP family intramembrane metalloprotease [Sedimentisphaerales bacterium]|nr:CPBP family intramembrane metalloprotease [Sedimentisphaerales bacterium]
MEFDNIINIDKLILFTGILLFALWARKTSLGKKALTDSTPRRNNMPLYLPFIPFFICFGTILLVTSVAKNLSGDLQKWQSDFFNNFIICIFELTTVVLIIFLAKIYFARGLKGFGLNIKTIARDFFLAFVNLLTVWPLIISAMSLTIYFGELIWGQEYQMQQHQQLQMITEHSQVLSRILIALNAIIVVPLFEEMLFRGLFQTAIRSYIESFHSLLIRENKLVKEQTTDNFGPWPAIVISSALFTITHVNAGHWPALLVLGVCLGYSYEKSGSLFRPVFIHAIFNAISVIATFESIT